MFQRFDNDDDDADDDNAEANPRRKSCVQDARTTQHKT